MSDNRFINLRAVLKRSPDALARISGSPDFPQIDGSVRFYQTDHAAVVAAEVYNLPAPPSRCTSAVLGFHIHSGDRCSGNESDPFADALAHYDPHGCPHPYHAGDLPPLFSCGGHALSLFLTDRFTVSEIIGKTVIIHSKPDDFTSQPSGNSGIKIACGIIEPY